MLYSYFLWKNMSITEQFEREPLLSVLKEKKKSLVDEIGEIDSRHLNRAPFWLQEIFNEYQKDYKFQKEIELRRICRYLNQLEPQPDFPVSKNFSDYRVIRDTIPIKLVAEEYLAKGREVGKYHCPKHNDKRPSLSIDEKRNRFRCFQCDFHGSNIDLVMFCESIDFTAALTILNKFDMTQLGRKGVNHEC